METYHCSPLGGKGPVIGIVVLGQTPRPEVVETYETYLPGVEFLIRGALDGLSDDDILRLSRKGGEYPLMVVLSRGRTREISLFELIPFVEDKLADLSIAGAETALLICSGDFPDLRSPIPVIYPARLASSLAQVLAPRGVIGVITPNAGQRASARNHWQAKGFRVEAEVAPPSDSVALQRAAERMKAAAPDLIVLDCMGFDAAHRAIVRRITSRPTLCPKTLVARVLAETWGE